MPPGNPLSTSKSHHHPLSTTTTTTSKQEKRVEAAITFTQTLLTLLTSSQSGWSSSTTADLAEIPNTDKLVADIRPHIDALHALQQRPYIHGVSGDPEIDVLGTKLWNLCTRLRRELVSGGDIGDGGDGGKGDGRGAEGGKEGMRRVRKLVLYGRVLALHLVVICRPKGSSGSSKEVAGLEGARGKARMRELVRVLTLVLKAGRDCVEFVGSAESHGVGGGGGKEKGASAEGGDGDERKGNEEESRLATNVMQIAADYKGVLQDLVSAAGKTGLDEEDIQEYNCLEVEYFILRTALSWIDNRLDVAEHMYTKGELLHKFLTVDYAEKLADVLYEIGKSLSVRHDYALAVKWLERANAVINTQSLDKLSREGVELRLAVFQALVTAFLGTDTHEGLEKAKNLVDFVESEVGSTKLIVSLLRLELLQKTPAEVFDDDAYSEVLRRMVRNFSASNSGFKLIMHHIRKLHDKSPSAACAVLDDFILVIRNTGDKVDWTERVVITRMWMIAHQRDSTASIEAVRSVISHMTTPLSPEAAVAAQALIWRKMEINYTQSQFDLSERWAHISLHSIFKNGGSVNRAKVQRKLLLCALARNSLDGAVALIKNMPQQDWSDEPMTAYLVFKVAVRVGDRELAERCLEAVSKTTDHIDYLGACIAESQKAEDIYSAISGLKKLHDKYQHKVPNKIHLPALFRCAIRLLNYLLDRPEDKDKKGAIVEELCCEFDAVVTAIKQHEATTAGTTQKLFSVDELEWFSRNAYNLALKNTSTWDLRCVVRMLTACVEIISYFPADYSQENTVDLSLKTLFSRFIISSALVSLARVQDRVDDQKRNYKEVRGHVGRFDAGLVELLMGSESIGKGKECLDQQCRNDMNRKLATLMVFDFEAALALGDWNDLGSIVVKVKWAGPDRHGGKGGSGVGVLHFQAMADCLLRAAATSQVMPGQVLYSTMRKIINEIWALEEFDAVKLAKYTRCLFQATLPLDDGLSMNLLDESCKKAMELRGSNATHWPDEELEWMATMSFNHAIDCYGAHEFERSKQWATKAIELAHYCNDEGGLENLMRKKFGRMKFDKGHPAGGIGMNMDIDDGIL